jgi:hypothetical protein
MTTSLGTRLISGSQYPLQEPMAAPASAAAGMSAFPTALACRKPFLNSAFNVCLLGVGPSNASKNIHTVVSPLQPSSAPD